MSDKSGYIWESVKHSAEHHAVHSERIMYTWGLTQRKHYIFRANIMIHSFSLIQILTRDLTNCEDSSARAAGIFIMPNYNEEEVHSTGNQLYWSWNTTIIVQFVGLMIAMVTYEFSTNIMAKQNW